MLHVVVGYVREDHNIVNKRARVRGVRAKQSIHRALNVRKRITVPYEADYRLLQATWADKSEPVVVWRMYAELIEELGSVDRYDEPLAA